LGAKTSREQDFRACPRVKSYEDDSISLRSSLPIGRRVDLLVAEELQKITNYYFPYFAEAISTLRTAEDSRWTN